MIDPFPHVKQKVYNSLLGFYSMLDLMDCGDVEEVAIAVGALSRHQSTDKDEREMLESIQVALMKYARTLDA